MPIMSTTPFNAQFVIKDDRKGIAFLIGNVNEKIGVRIIPYSSLENMDELLKEAINHDK